MDTNSGNFRPKPPAVTQVSRQMRAEAMRVYWTKKTFCFIMSHMHSGTNVFRRWLLNVPEPCLQLVRKVRIRFAHFPTESQLLLILVDTVRYPACRFSLLVWRSKHLKPARKVLKRYAALASNVSVELNTRGAYIDDLD